MDRLMARRSVLVAGLALLWLLSDTLPAVADGIETPIASDDVVSVRAKRAAEIQAAHAAATAANDPAARLVEYARMEQCEGPGYIYPVAQGPCPGADGSIPLPDCGGYPPLLPLWRHERATPQTDAWTDWVRVAEASCPQDVLPAFTAEDFRRLPLAPTATQLHPSDPNLLTGLGVVVTATPTAQELPTTLLGFPITVRATPTDYTWDYGDGATITTTHPGEPFPTTGRVRAGTFPPGVIGHPYPRLGTYTITLTTTWSGEYHIAGTATWRPINGTATTTTTHPPVTIHESRSHLVADTCHDNPTGPGC